jgi:hypothetical protein
MCGQVLRNRSKLSYYAVVVRASTVDKIADIAEDQWGMVTRRQAEQAGVSPATIVRLSRPGSILERVAHGVYRLRGAPVPDLPGLRAAWLQLAPGTPGWQRSAADGIVSHRSAAAVYGIGELPADRHEFTVPTRRQTRRADVRLHVRDLDDAPWIMVRGLPVTRPARIISDLLDDNEDLEAVARIMVEAIDEVYDYPGTIAEALAKHASRFGLAKGDGLALLRSLLDLSGDPHGADWLAEAETHFTRPPTPKSEDRSSPPSRSRIWTRA